MFSINEKVDNAKYEQREFWTNISNAYSAKKTMKDTFVSSVINEWLYDMNEVIDEQLMNEIGGEESYLDYLRASMTKAKEIILKIKTLYDKQADEIKSEVSDHDLNHVTDIADDCYYVYGIDGW